MSCIRAASSWLSRRFTVIALDNPGYGSSDKLDHPDTLIGDYAEALAETNETAINHRQNRILQVLTVLTGVFLPVTFVTNLFGMNVPVPFQHTTFAFAAMVAMNRAFTVEREHGAFDGLLLAPIPRGALFAGKLLANLAFVMAVEAVALPLFVLFFNVDFSRVLGGIVGTAVLATIGFVAVGTIFGAMLTSIAPLNNDTYEVTLTLDAAVVRQDCLCYLMERLDPAAARG